MNGRTSKLIRSVAAIRGNTSPRYIRSLKRAWNNLSDEQKELQRIEYQVEVDDFINEMTHDYELDLMNQRKQTEMKKRDAGHLKARLKGIEKQVVSAAFFARLKYLFSGKLEALTQ